LRALLCVIMIAGAKLLRRTKRRSLAKSFLLFLAVLVRGR